LVEATTQEKELVVDPCAGSFIVLEVCQEIGREFFGVDLTYNELLEYKRERERDEIREIKPLLINTDDKAHIFTH
jgi:hypothetical protein